MTKFQFNDLDNGPTDKRADPSNVDSNKGIVTTVYEPYDKMLLRMKEINQYVRGRADHPCGENRK